ncbi:MAG: DUF819 family protein [Sphingopyxis sp.]|uniref:DUF819 family protein n=1 Tax=Sphingopyxis sp. TaxID=1908224 RepID=UPI002ABAADAB|nr:DUF819 family protein [Sphingopyxis sp.]MDZ3833292.1 DUF819 family protein [Sphingopyxis sp.]
MAEPLITSDVVTFGILCTIVGTLFYLRGQGGGWDRFFTFVPIVLLCYLVPSLLASFGVIGSGEEGLWPAAKDYFLPAALILLTLNIDLKGVWGLGPKALIMFFTATVGVVIGGPLAVMIVGSFSPDAVGGTGADATWRGLSTLAGSWIGGGANQTAMLEIYGYNPELYSAMVAVDIVVANIWMAVLLYGAGMSARIDRWLDADASAISTLQQRMADFSQSVQEVPTLERLMLLLAVTFGGVGLSHLGADMMSAAIGAIPGYTGGVLASRFFWVVVIATSYGLILSFTRARRLEGAGASKFGSVMIFLLVAIIGTRMDVFKLADNPTLFLVGLIWILIHVLLLLTVAKLIRAPFFFVAVGSKANIGGAASAPVVAAAFHPALAPVGVLLAVLGYALGTYGAIISAELMRMVAP